MKYDRSRIRAIAENLINEGLDKKRILEVIQNLKKADEAITMSVNNYLKKCMSKQKQLKMKLSKIMMRI